MMKKGMIMVRPNVDWGVMCHCGHTRGCHSGNYGYGKCIEPNVECVCKRFRKRDATLKKG